MTDRTGHVIRVAKFQPPPNPENPALLARAREHLAAAGWTRWEAPSLPAYGRQWQPYVEQMRDAIPLFTKPIEALHYAQSNIPFDHRISLPPELVLYHFYDRFTQHEFPEQLDLFLRMQENLHAIPGSLIWYQGYPEESGRIVSNILFWHARTVLSCLAYCGTPQRIPEIGLTYCGTPRRILEIGGGYGPIARLWLKYGGAERYVIADIPESLFFAEIALGLEFGADKVGYFLDGKDPQTPILLVPLGELERFDTPSDLVINVGSMQEMPDAWVDFYMDFLDRYDSKYFYSLNYAGQRIRELAESQTWWGPRPSNAWSTRVLNPDIVLVKHQSLNRNWLEAVYEKMPATQSLDDWAVWRGRALTLQTYLEGLDLLRQDLNPVWARQFYQRCTQTTGTGSLMFKELAWIAAYLERQQTAAA